MKEKINIAELLKDCPSGMELDCTMWDSAQLNVVMDGNTYPIKIQTPDGIISLTKDGCYSLNPHCKCIIFPKGKTTWEGFVPPCQFKDGDVIYNADIKAVAIFNKQTDMVTISHCFLNILGKFMICHYHSKDLSDWKLATEEEKQKLFDAIKSNGYKWNEETKTLGKLLKFKVGDTITNGDVTSVIKQITKDSYILDIKDSNICFNYVFFENQDKWKLIPNKFDISTLVPFESKVLVRDINDDNWIGAFYSHYKSEQFHVIGNLYYYQCIPYEGNEHLLGTNNDCDEFYKNW